MALYDDRFPGLGDRIVVQFESQGNHRRRIEQLEVEGDLARAKQGMLSATVISVMALVGAVICGMTGHEWATASLVTIVPVMGLGQFLSRRWRDD